MPEKLLTLGEAASLLGISEEEVKRFVEKGDLPAYRIGGRFLRFRREQIWAIQSELPAKKGPTPPVQKALSRRQQRIPYTESVSDRILDFFYFKDFYIISIIITLVIVWFIARS
jgi:excisionase family DNA binding protein